MKPFIATILIVGLMPISLTACGSTVGSEAEAAAPTPAEAQAGSSAESAESRRREAVITSARRMHPNAELTARTAYEAIDYGASSQAAIDLGGLDVAQKWIGRFERNHDIEQLTQCIQSYSSSDPAGVAVLFDNIVAAGHSDRVIASAENHAGAELATLRSQNGVPTDAALVQMSIAALLSRGGDAEEVDPERLGIEARILMALGTKGKCVPSQRLIEFDGDTRQPR